MAEREIGQVDDFFARPVVAGGQLMDSLRIGDTIHILGHATHLTMVVHSMPISDADVEEVTAGQAIGVKVPRRMRVGDCGYMVT